MSYRNQSVGANQYRQDIVDLMMKIQSDAILSDPMKSAILTPLTEAASNADKISSYAQDMHESND